MEKTKLHFNIVVIGHVDSGKSTFCGHLLYKCGGIQKSVLEQAEKDATDAGKGSFKYAWVMDRLKSSRERCLTIDISFKQFQTPKYHYTIIDTPGHRDFIKNMIIGISQADIAILVAPVSSKYFGDSETCTQTKEYSLMAFSLGVKNIIVVVNKMDDPTVNYSSDLYLSTKQGMELMLRKIGFKKIYFVPVSGFNGDNLTEKSEKMVWYNGSTVVETLDSIEIDNLSIRPTNMPLRVPICGVYKIGGIGTVVVGTVKTGILKKGMKVIFAPGNLVSEVKSIQIHHKEVSEAIPGDYVGFTVDLDSKSIKRGCVAVDAVNPPSEIETFIAQVRIINHPGVIRVGYTPVICCQTANVACKFEKIEVNNIVHKDEGLKIGNDHIKTGDNASIVMRPTKPIFCEEFSQSPFGRVLIRDLKQIVAVGFIKSVTKKA